MRLLEIITNDTTYHTSVNDLEEELKVLDDLHKNGFIKLVYLDDVISIDEIKELRSRDWMEVI